MTGTLLVVGGTDHGNQNTKYHTDAQGNGGNQQCGTDAAEILGVSGPKEAMDILSDMESAFRNVLGEDEEDDYNADDFWEIPD